jgi:hypothetical protein
MTRSAPQAIRPAPEGAVFNEDGPARTPGRTGMLLPAGPESRHSPAFGLLGHGTNSRPAAGCGLFV